MRYTCRGAALENTVDVFTPTFGEIINERIRATREVNYARVRSYLNSFACSQTNLFQVKRIALASA